MKARSFQLIAGVSIIALTILSCSSPLQLFATPTPTATFTATPTITLTPTSTSTPTATPVPPPPVQISACVFADECPEAVWVGDYLAADLQTKFTTRVDFPYTDSVRMDIGWCTLNETILADNIQHITYIFTIDGISYLDYARIEHGYMTDANDPSIQYPCSYIGAMLSGWQLYGNHLVTIGYSFDTTINDGWNTFAPFSDKYIFELKPGLIPTATPTETPTNTPRPLPTIPYHTPVPACDATSSLQISNTTGGQVTLYLDGPASYTFYLSTGDTTLSVCPGTYSYLAYGCGGASDSGSMTSGESHEFYCSG